MNDEDLALGHVLGTLDDEARSRAEERLATDPGFAAAVADSKRDLEAIRRGLELVAATSAGTPAARRRGWVWASAAATIVAVGIVGVLTMGRGDERTLARQTPPGIVNPVPGPTLSLQQKVAGAEAIVVGTVTDVETGSFAGDGMDYAMATVRVEERLKGETGASVVAFDYVYGIVSSEGGPSGVWAKPGDRLLLFLVSDAGTASEDLEPAHLQIFEGPGGRFRVNDGELVDAPFTLQDVREEAARSTN